MAQDVYSVEFQDAMDRTRFLRIKEEKKDTVVCRVYFEGRGKAHIYHGCVELPKRMFFLDGFTNTGFNIWDPQKEAQEAKWKAMKEERKRTEREEV